MEEHKSEELTMVPPQEPLAIQLNEERPESFNVADELVMERQRSNSPSRIQRHDSFIGGDRKDSFDNNSPTGSPQHPSQLGAQTVYPTTSGGLPEIPVIDGISLMKAGSKGRNFESFTGLMDTSKFNLPSG